MLKLTAVQHFNWCRTYERNFQMNVIGVCNFLSITETKYSWQRCLCKAELKDPQGDGSGICYPLIIRQNETSKHESLLATQQKVE